MITATHPMLDDILIAYAAGERTPAAATPVRDHLAACAACAATVVRYQMVAAMVREGEAFAPPPALLARAKAIFPRRSSLSELLAPLRRIAAELTFDSRVGFSPALAGFRGGMSGYQLAFVGGGTEVDLQMEPPTMVGARWHLMGQVSTAGATPTATVSLTLPASIALAVTEAKTDEYGMFAFSVPPGRYDLLVQLADAVVVLPDLDVG